MALRYWISNENNKYYLYVKVSQPQGSTRQYQIEKNPSYAPDNPSTFWDFFDHFGGDALSSNWDDTNAADYAVSDSTLTMWGNWGTCCSGSCYANGIESTQTFDLPLIVRIAFNQENYTSATTCGKTGPGVAYKNSEQVMVSTDSDNSDGLTVRINSTKHNNLNISHFPDIYPAYAGLTIYFSPNGVYLRDFYDTDTEVLETAATTTGQPLVLSGDTDKTNVLDHVDYIAVASSKPTPPKVSLVSQTENTILIEVDDSSTNDNIDLTDQIIIVDVTGFVNSVTEGLNIYDNNTYMLFTDNADNGRVYKWDGSQFAYINKTTSQLAESDFTLNGILNYVEINKSQLQTLANTVYVLAYPGDNAISQMNMNLSFVPYKRLIVQQQPAILSNFSLIKSMNIVTTGTDNVSEKSISILLSRNGTTWYKWDTANNQWVSPGDKTLDYSNSADIDWVFNNGETPITYNNLTQDDWSSFFIPRPDKIYFAIAINYDSPASNIGIDRVDVIADTNEYYINDESEIHLTEKTITIKFSNDGHYIINYID